MTYFNSLVVSAFLLNAVPPICRGFPTLDDTSKTGRDNVLNIDNQDKERNRIDQTNITDNKKVNGTVFTSANKSYDSSINANLTTPINISGVVESSQTKNKSEELTDKKDISSPVFTYYVKIKNGSINEDFQNKTILGEKQSVTNKKFDHLHPKIHLQEETVGKENQDSLKLDNIYPAKPFNMTDSKAGFDMEDTNAKKTTAILEQTETTRRNETNNEKSSSALQGKESDNERGYKDYSDSDVSTSIIQGKESDIAQRYRVKSGIQLEEPTSRIVVTVMKRSGRYWEPWELNHNVCPPSLCTASEENRPKGTGDSNILSNLSLKPNHTYPTHRPGGSVFFNGDIVLDRESEEQIYGPYSRRIRWKRAASRGSNKLWKDGIVPYTFSDVLPKSLRSIKKAIAHIEKHTCIRFRRKKLRDEDYIRFISEPGCWSNVGRVGGEQKVSIGRGCERLGTAIHEITHSLGFWHEQARPDRDKYVEILEENVSPRYLPDFEPVNKTLVGSRGFPYDYESVMHYSKKAFTNLGEDTIKVIGIGKKLKMKIGQRDMLSNLDIAQLRDMYKCNDKEDEKVTVCPSGWEKNRRSCYKFITDLKYQFAAAAKHCETLNSHLLHIDDQVEDKYIKKRVKKKYPRVEVWRTGGRKFGKEFAWYTGDGKEPKKMQYTKWKKGHPAGFSSMALVHNKTADRVRWEGVWSGSASQYPQHAYPFVCERRAKRKCIKGMYPNGRDYRGTLDHTIDGITCQKWSSRYPHSHKLLPYPYKDTGKEDPDGLGDHNYCRNPSKNRKRRPWCFTDKKKIQWQYCDVSICSKSSGNKSPVKQTSSNKNTKYNSHKLTSSEKANNKKGGYSTNEINADIKGSNKRNNEIQRDQKQTSQKRTKQNTKNRNRGKDNRNNKNSDSKRGSNSRGKEGSANRNSNRQNSNRNTQNRLRDRRKESQSQNGNNRGQASGNRKDGLRRSGNRN